MSFLLCPQLNLDISCPTIPLLIEYTVVGPLNQTDDYVTLVLPLLTTNITINSDQHWRVMLIFNYWSKLQIKNEKKEVVENKNFICKNFLNNYSDKLLHFYIPLYFYKVENLNIILRHINLIL